MASHASTKALSSTLRTGKTKHLRSWRARSSAKTWTNWAQNQYSVRPTSLPSTRTTSASKARSSMNRTRGWRWIRRRNWSKIVCASSKKKMKEWIRRFARPSAKPKKWTRYAKNKTSGTRWCRSWRRSRSGSASSRKWRTKRLSRWVNPDTPTWSNQYSHKTRTTTQRFARYAKTALRKSTISYRRTHWGCRRNSLGKNRKKFDLKICTTVWNTNDSTKTRADTTTKLYLTNRSRTSIMLGWTRRRSGSRRWSLAWRTPWTRRSRP